MRAILILDEMVARIKNIDAIKDPSLASERLSRMSEFFAAVDRFGVPDEVVSAMLDGEKIP